MASAASVGNLFSGGDIESIVDPFGHMSSLTGQAGADAALAGAEMQAKSAREALEYTKEKDALQRADLMPFTQFGSNFMPFYTGLLNPQNQANYLQNNPMFQAAMEKSNTGLKNTLGFQGKRGDLANAITQNYMATGNQYTQQALNNLLQPIQISQASAAGQAANTGANMGAVNQLLTGIGNAQAAGGIGAANALSQGAGNVATLGAGLIGAFMSDRRLKKHITRIGKRGPYNVYAWQYRGGGDAIYVGVMADEVERINPRAVVMVDGFKAVDYGAL